jgi:hypothetical protein
MKHDKKVEPIPARKKDEPPEDKIHRHLRDKNDIITNEDIRDFGIDKILVPGPEEKNEKIAGDI